MNEPWGDQRPTVWQEKLHVRRPRGRLCLALLTAGRPCAWSAWSQEKRGRGRAATQISPDEDVDSTGSGGCCLVTKLYLTLLQPHALSPPGHQTRVPVCQWTLLLLSHQRSHIFFSFAIIGYYKILSIVPCVIQILFAKFKKHVRGPSLGAQSKGCVWVCSLVGKLRSHRAKNPEHKAEATL